MMYLDITIPMIVLVYPNNQTETFDINLRSLDFKQPSEVLGTHATTAEIVWQTREQTKIREFKVAQRIENFQVINRTPTTENDFIKLKEDYHDYLGNDTQFDQIVKLYCVFDELIANTPKEQLIVEERTAQNYLDDSERSAS